MKKGTMAALVLLGLASAGTLAAYLRWRRRNRDEATGGSFIDFAQSITNTAETTPEVDAVTHEGTYDQYYYENYQNQQQMNTTPTTTGGKTAAGLIAYAKAQLGRPYWFGTSGQIATQELLTKKRKAYPGYYTANDFENQLGKKVHDCCGLIEGYFWSADANSAAVYASNGFPDYTADGLLNKATEKGPISTIPEIPGLSVHKSGHVGIYIGNGEVIEARGHDYGVVITKLSSRNWKNWAKIPGLKY